MRDCHVGKPVSECCLVVPIPDDMGRGVHPGTDPMMNHRPIRSSLEMRERITIVLDGLSLGGGGTLMVERRLQTLPGVLRAYASPVTEMAYIDYDPDLVTRRVITDTIERAGFRAGEISVR